MKAAILLLLLASWEPGQQDIRTDALDQVPPSLRAELQSALITALNAQVKGDWNALYGMQWPKTLEHESKIAFESAHKDFGLMEDGFSVIRVERTTGGTTTSKDGMWTILGCAQFSKINNSQSIEAMTTIYLVDGHWYVQDIRPVLQMESAKSSPCKLSEGIDPKALFKK